MWSCQKENSEKEKKEKQIDNWLETVRIESCQMKTCQLQKKKKWIKSDCGKGNLRKQSRITGKNAPECPRNAGRVTRGVTTAPPTHPPLKRAFWPKIRKKREDWKKRKKCLQCSKCSLMGMALLKQATQKRLEKTIPVLPENVLSQNC